MSARPETLHLVVSARPETLHLLVSARPETLHLVVSARPGSSRSLSGIQASAVIISSLCLCCVNKSSVYSAQYQRLLVSYMDKKTLHSRKKLPNFKATFPSNSNRTPSIVKKVNREGNCIYSNSIPHYVYYYYY